MIALPIIKDFAVALIGRNGFLIALILGGVALIAADRLRVHAIRAEAGASVAAEITKQTETQSAKAHVARSRALSADDPVGRLLRDYCKDC